VVLTGAVFLGASCGAPAPNRSSVLFVTIDTLRPDHLGTYGNPRARTPCLDSLARRGVLFADARVPYPLTLPSHATLFTGALPYRHGARRNDSFGLDPTLPVLSERASEQGCATAAIISTFVLNRDFGLARGFGSYLDLSAPEDLRRNRVERRAGEVTDLARAWLDGRPDSTFLLWTHYFDPHDDYEPPFPYDRVYAGGAENRYDGEIAYTDLELARLFRGLDARRDRDRHVIVVTSDHGEAFGEHGEWGHGFFLYDTTVRVPLIVARGARRMEMDHPRIRGEFVRSIDLLPTTCALAGWSAPEAPEGRDLDPFGAPPSGGVPLYLETFEPTVGYGATDLRGVVGDGWKAILAPIPELYDLGSDPHERRNLAGEEPEREEALREILEGHLDAERTAGRAATADERVDEDTRARLLAIGYLGSTPAEEEATAWSRRDPKEIVQLIPRMDKGVEHCRNGRWEKGLPLLEEVLREDPLNGKALHWIARARMRAEDPDGAVEVYRTALEHDPFNPGLLNRIGVLYLRTKRFDEAVETFEKIVRVDPRNVSAHLNAATAYSRTARPRRARAAVERALEIDPVNPLATRIARQMGILPPAEER
jgi:arylsulfatase A-like enzyme